MSGVGPVSVAAVVPSYNYGTYLAQAVDSLLAQDPPYTEVVVVDDGSTDDSLAVARGYGDRVRVVSKANGGQLSACLAGLDAVRSEYVHFLDADDLAVPGLLDVLRPALADRPVKVQFPLAAMTADRVATGSVFPSFAAGYGSAQMVQDNRVLGFYVCSPSSGNVYRRDVLLGLDRSVLDPRDSIDGPATLVLPYLGAVVSLDVPLVRYRVHGDNDSQWYRPTPDRLRYEVEWFGRRWAEVCALLGREGPPFGRLAPGYVLERDLMTGALEGRAWLLPPAVAFARRLVASRMPRKQVAALVLWGFLLVLPVPRARAALVAYRRDPARRPALARWLVSGLRTFRRMVPSPGTQESARA